LGFFGPLFALAARGAFGSLAAAAAAAAGGVSVDSGVFSQLFVPFFFCCCVAGACALFFAPLLIVARFRIVLRARARAAAVRMRIGGRAE
jgi:hypothetical protein